MTIVPASSQPGLQGRLTTGDAAFDSDVFVAAAEPSAYGLLDFHTRAALRRLVAEKGFVFTDGALRRESEEEPLSAIHRELEDLSERLTRTETEALDALHVIALEDPIDEVRRRYQMLSESTVFERDLSRVDQVMLDSDLSTMTSFEPLADLVRNRTIAPRTRLTAFERLMSHHRLDKWEQLTSTLADALPSGLVSERVVPRLLEALEGEENVRAESIDRLADIALHSENPIVNPGLALRICALVQRATEESVEDIATVYWILEAFCEHPDDTVVRAALALLFARDPNRLRSLHWLEEFGEFVARATPLARGTPFENLIRETVHGRLRRRLASTSEQERHQAVALLADHGHPEHLPLLVPLTRGFFQSRRTKVLARQAVEEVRRRHPTGHLEGAMSVAGTTDSGLSLVEPMTDKTPHE